jgi:hypothetical protein
MSVRHTTVVPANAASAAQIVQSWREHFCGGGIDQLLTELFSPLTRRQRISATIDGSNVQLEPSWFAKDSVVLVFHRPDTQNLRVVFFDQAAGQFLPAIASLTMTERGKLGAGRKRDREAFLASLIETARAAVPSRRPVGV